MAPDADPILRLTEAAKCATRVLADSPGPRCWRRGAFGHPL